MTIKQTLQEANKYEDVIKILTDITQTHETSFPVDAFVDEENITRWRVDGELVRKEAQEVLNTIEGTVEKNNYNLTNILQYARTQSIMMLHNYAVQISHRDEPLEDIDDIRSWEVLETLIVYLCDREHTREIFVEDYTWSIPKG